MGPPPAVPQRGEALRLPRERLQRPLEVPLPQGHAPNGRPGRRRPGLPAGLLHYAARNVATLKAYIRTRRDEAEAEGGAYDPRVFEGVPFRLVLAKEPGAEPYTGSWDNAPWEDA